MFRHPLFFIKDHTGALPLVVPEYFFNDGASFDGLTDPGTTSYYIFPYFAQKLFEYVMGSHTRRDTSFAAYYASREVAWFAPVGVDMSQFIIPHPTLRRHWRWEDVLEILHSREGPGKGRPRWCQSAPPGYHEIPQIKDYLDCFVGMAEAWVIEHRVEPNVY